MLEFFVDFFLEVYVELMVGFFPKAKGKKAVRVIATVIAAVMLIGILALAFWGVVLIENGKLWFGIAVLALALLLSLVQIGLGLHFHNDTDES